MIAFGRLREVCWDERRWRRDKQSRAVGQNRAYCCVLHDVPQ
jgi:hypothetical protein